MTRSNPTKALVDGDILCYRIGWSCERKDEPLEPDWVAKARLDTLLTTMLDKLEISEYDLFLTSSDKSNFRFELADTYKANRITPKPQHYEFLRKVMREEYGAITVDNEEADDAMGYSSDGDSTVICSTDKDMDQIPGWHYNFVKEVLYYIEPIEAARWFYQQVLIGDTSDNIQGCPGIGKVRANRILEGCQSEQEMLDAVVEQYANKVKNHWEEKLLLAGNLLWIRKKPNQKWVLPSGEVVSNETVVNSLNGLV